MLPRIKKPRRTSTPTLKVFIPEKKVLDKIHNTPIYDAKTLADNERDQGERQLLI